MIKHGDIFRKPGSQHMTRYRILRFHAICTAFKTRRVAWCHAHAQTEESCLSNNVSLNTNSFLCSFLCVRASLASKMDYKEKSQRRLTKAEVSTISSNQKRERVKCKSRPTASLQKKKKNSKNTNGVWCESKTCRKRKSAQCTDLFLIFCTHHRLPVCACLVF